ncbi:MAG: helix-turn-helix domain-containing protein [Myxococcota bacterium]
MTVQPSTPISQTTPPQEPEATAGHMLHEARVRLGLSLADVASVTRIPRNMLEHLERDRFEEYSANVFVRGHLRNFAREVRLDPQKILTAFDRQTGHTPAEVKSFEVVTKPAKQQAKRASKTLRRRYPQLYRVFEAVRPVHMAALLLILCAFFATVFFLNGSNATAQDPETFGATPAQDWSLEQDTERTKWLLEQPASATDD